jgi:threonine dehydratase
MHDDVVAAAERIGGAVERTPLIETQIRGARLWLKCECLQTGGSFKLRGATNRLIQLSHEERKRGVVAFSSGNHAQGVAIAAKRLGITAVIVMPSDAPALKVEGTRAQGAEIVFYDRQTEDRVTIAEKIARETGATVVPSFDDPHIVAGQGTVGLEIIGQLADVGAALPARIVVNCGGGGLSAGIALACPDAEVVPVEPVGWDDMLQSLEKGEIVPVGPDAPPTMCDAIQTPLVSPITFGILLARGARGVAVSEEEVAEAVRWAWQEHKLTVEPGGAASIAAMLSGKVEIVPETVVVVSGGNIDPALHARLIG